MTSHSLDLITFITSFVKVEGIPSLTARIREEISEKSSSGKGKQRGIKLARHQVSAFIDSIN